MFWSWKEEGVGCQGVSMNTLFQLTVYTGHQLALEGLQRWLRRSCQDAEQRQRRTSLKSLIVLLAKTAATGVLATVLDAAIEYRRYVFKCHLFFIRLHRFSFGLILQEYKVSVCLLASCLLICTLQATNSCCSFTERRWSWGWTLRTLSIQHALKSRYLSLEGSPVDRDWWTWAASWALWHR